MADKFIDLDEMQYYGPYTTRMLRERVMGIVPEYDAALKKLVIDLDDATISIKQLLEASRQAQAKVRINAQAKGPVLKQALDLLGRFSRHLDSHPRGSIDRKTFFPEDGTAHGIGKSAPRVLVALSRICTELKKNDSSLRDRSHWQDETEQVYQALAPMIAHSENAKTERTVITPELEGTRQTWLRTYLAAKCTVEGLLRLSDKVHMMPTIFYDLAVPGSTKIAASPPEPPIESEPGASGVAAR